MQNWTLLTVTPNTETLLLSRPVGSIDCVIANIIVTFTADVSSDIEIYIKNSEAIKAYIYKANNTYSDGPLYLDVKIFLNVGDSIYVKSSDSNVSFIANGEVIE
jgi:hypothetical protein